jgi:Asp-tRNA(Asn)/Glu-tRNA(Gln) amidotransferase B subunit
MEEVSLLRWPLPPHFNSATVGFSSVRCQRLGVQGWGSASVGNSVRNKESQQCQERHDRNQYVGLNMLSSASFLTTSLDAEAHRQVGLLQLGRRVTQQTLYFDEHTAITQPLRSKEDAQDYRYMPDPNIPPIIIGQALLAEIKEEMPELSYESRKRLVEEYGLKPHDVDILLGIDTGRTVGWDGVLEDGGVGYFEGVVDSSGARRDPKVVLNWLVSFP